jgi:hypothetical protein
MSRARRAQRTMLIGSFEPNRMEDSFGAVN